MARGGNECVGGSRGSGNNRGDSLSRRSWHEIGNVYEIGSYGSVLSIFGKVRCSGRGYGRWYFDGSTVQRSGELVFQDSDLLVGVYEVG